MGSARKGWSYSAGERGRNRVRAFEDNKSGMVTLEFYEQGRFGLVRKRVSLGHGNKERAKQQADKTAAELAEAECPRPERSSNPFSPNAW